MCGIAGMMMVNGAAPDEALIDMREGVDHYVHNAKAHKGAVKAAYE